MHAFELFVGMAAAIHGQLFNTADLSRQCGVSLPTIKAWASVLEASWLCYLQQPYFKNYGKRLVKTPKLYFLDTALICTLTKQPDAQSALAGALAGPLVEGFMISEAVKVFAMIGMPCG